MLIPNFNFFFVIIDSLDNLYDYVFYGVDLLIRMNHYMMFGLRLIFLFVFCLCVTVWKRSIEIGL